MKASGKGDSTDDGETAGKLVIPAKLMYIARY